MADEDEVTTTPTGEPVTQPLPATPAGATAPAATLPPDAPARAPRQKLTDRLWSFRALLAVALASVLIGGAGGAALAAATNNDGQIGHGGPRGGFGPGFGHGPRQFPNQAPGNGFGRGKHQQQKNAPQNGQQQSSPTAPNS